MKKLKIILFTILVVLFCLQPAIARDYDVMYFSGNEETYTTLDNTLAATGGTANGKALTILTSTDHGFKVGSYVWISGTTNYDGLRLIQAVAANTITIYAKYVAEVPAGTETLKAAAYLNQKKNWELLGFRVHLNAASATSENLVVAIDSAQGTAFDAKLYSKDMNTLQDVLYKFDPVVK